VDRRPLLIVDLDGPILDVAPRYFAAHEEALAVTPGATSLCADVASFWEAKRRSQPVAEGEAGAEAACAAAFKERIERDDLLRLDRLQPGALAALERLAARHTLHVLSLRTNVAGARATVERLGVTALAPVIFVPHGPMGKVEEARQRFGAVAADILAVIGDTEADAAVAEALAVPFWAVSGGIRTAERLRGFGAVRVEASLEAYAP
jgi:phosphoglycolate phosphatase-like HAD superfamily hydrolase